jgi:hypothetical protein
VWHLSRPALARASSLGQRPGAGGSPGDV